MIENGEIGTVIVKDMSRLGRNFLQVGLYTDMLFPDNDVRFIAINDGVDSAVQTEFDMTPIRNFFNELFARDTAKKIRVTLKMKGESGKPLCSKPPYGYVKSAENKDVWEIDEVAAEVVRKIFKLCTGGYGPAQIAKTLKEENILTPAAYVAEKTGKPYKGNPYKWDHATIGRILERLEYLGHTVNFRTTNKSPKSSKRVNNPVEKQMVFLNTHPAIIDENSYEIVQKIRENKRRPTATGKVSIFSGKVFCADCGSKLYYCTTKYFDDSQDFFNCSQYRKDTSSCTVHYIRQQTLMSLVFRHIKSMLSYVQQFEESFVREKIEKADRVRERSILNMAIILCLLASLLFMTSCENSLAESSVHKNEKVSVLDFKINIKMGVRYGERCAMFTYQNNSAYKLTDFTLTLKPKDNLTETEIEELYALIQKEYHASDSEMEMVKQYGVDVLSIEMWCYDDVLAGAESESEEIEGPFGDLESLDQLNYFEEDILEFTYVDENGDTNTVYYDYINKTYTHD